MEAFWRISDKIFVIKSWWQLQMLLFLFLLTLFKLDNL